MQKHASKSNYRTQPRFGQVKKAKLIQEKQTILENSLSFLKAKKVEAEEGSNFYPNLYVNQIRVHYFFSETTNIEKFLQESEIKIRFTNGAKWNNFLAEGSSKAISQFKNKQEIGQRLYSEVLCFFGDATYATLSLQAGLVCDGQFNTENQNLFAYNNIYFPDEGYYSTSPFPPEWMEMFDQSSVKLRDEFSEQIDYQKYSPKCTRNDLKKMIDYDPHKGRSKMSHVESKIKRVQSATNTIPRSYQKLWKEPRDPQLIFTNQDQGKKKPLRPMTSQIQRQSSQKKKRPATSIKQNNQYIPPKFQLSQKSEYHNITDPYQVLLENNQMTEQEIQIQKMYENNEFFGEDKENQNQIMLSQMQKINEQTQQNQKKQIRLDPILKPPQQKLLNQQEFQNFLNNQKLQTLAQEKNQLIRDQVKDDL